MGPIRVLFHRLAARELRCARNWYRERSVEAADRFSVAVNQAVSQIIARGDALPPVNKDYRYIRVNRFPYVLIFQTDGGGVVKVVAVAHTSRRPGYWRRRK